jgi:hypothetical protein
VPAFFISYFYNPFISTFLTKYFTVRSRACVLSSPTSPILSSKITADISLFGPLSFSSFLTNFAGIFSSFVLGYFVDKQSINIKTRAKVAFVRPPLRPL